MVNKDTIVKNLANKLNSSHCLLATAESCTGGLLAQTLTAVPECSPFFERGFICYSNESKIEVLDVESEIIEIYDAVSHQTAAAMARGALKHSRAHLAISITGEAGPEPSKPGNPIGVMYFGISCYHRDEIQVETDFCKFKGNRQQITDQAVLFALKKLFDFTKSMPKT